MWESVNVCKNARKYNFDCEKIAKWWWNGKLKNSEETVQFFYETFGLSEDSKTWIIWLAFKVNIILSVYGIDYVCLSQEQFLFFILFHGPVISWLKVSLLIYTWDISKNASILLEASFICCLYAYCNSFLEFVFQKGNNDWSLINHCQL